MKTARTKGRFGMRRMLALITTVSMLLSCSLSAYAGNTYVSAPTFSASNLTADEIELYQLILNLYFPDESYSYEFDIANIDTQAVEAMLKDYAAQQQNQLAYRKALEKYGIETTDKSDVEAMFADRLYTAGRDVVNRYLIANGLDRLIRDILVDPSCIDLVNPSGIDEIEYSGSRCVESASVLIKRTALFGYLEEKIEDNEVNISMGRILNAYENVCRRLDYEKIYYGWYTMCAEKMSTAPDGTIIITVSTDLHNRYDVVLNVKKLQDKIAKNKHYISSGWKLINSESDDIFEVIEDEHREFVLCSIDSQYLKKLCAYYNLMYDLDELSEDDTKLAYISLMNDIEAYTNAEK